MGAPASFGEFQRCNNRVVDAELRAMIIILHFSPLAPQRRRLGGDRLWEKAEMFFFAAARTRTLLSSPASGVEKQLVERCGQI